MKFIKTYEYFNFLGTKLKKDNDYILKYNLTAENKKGQTQITIAKGTIIKIIKIHKNSVSFMVNNEIYYTNKIKLIKYI